MAYSQKDPCFEWILFQGHDRLCCYAIPHGKSHPARVYDANINRSRLKPLAQLFVACPGFVKLPVVVTNLRVVTTQLLPVSVMISLVSSASVWLGDMMVGCCLYQIRTKVSTQSNSRWDKCYVRVPQTANVVVFQTWCFLLLAASTHLDLFPFVFTTWTVAF